MGNVSLTLQKFMRNFRNNACSMKLKTVVIVTTKKKKSIKADGELNASNYIFIYASKNDRTSVDKYRTRLIKGISLTIWKEK